MEGRPDGDTLTAIERSLVLQYLADANVPVTVTASDGECAVLPVAATMRATDEVPLAANMRSSNKTVHQYIKLCSPLGHVNEDTTLSRFDGRNVYIEFYFNKMGLTFNATMARRGDILCFPIPSDIRRIASVPVQHDTDFSCTIYYSCSNNASVHLDCLSSPQYTLFTRPVWKDIPLEHQWLAKTYLERFVSDVRSAGVAHSNALFLITVCHYLTDTPQHLDATEGTVKPFTALYIDHERLVFGSANETFPLVAGAEYAFRLSFALHRAGPVSRREIYTTARIASVYQCDDANTLHGGHRICADCVFTSLKEEDSRYLYEKATKCIIK